jgi:hypothetical protein
VTGAQSPDTANDLAHTAADAPAAVQAAPSTAPAPALAPIVVGAVVSGCDADDDDDVVVRDDPVDATLDLTADERDALAHAHACDDWLYAQNADDEVDVDVVDQLL